MLLYKLCEVQTIVSDLPVGGLCYYKVSEEGVSRNYFEKYNIKVKDYVLGSFLLQGHNCFYCPHGTRCPISWKYFHNSSNMGYWGAQVTPEGDGRRLRFARVAHWFRDIQRVSLL